MPLSPPPPPPPPPPQLIDDAISEILLRIPPDEPAHLFAAALVCKSWLRILKNPSFLSRYRVLHRAPPVLGYLYNTYDHDAPMPAFVPTTAASPLTMPAHDRRICTVSDCRHGRMLLRKIYSSRSERLIVWDPIMGHQKKLSLTVPSSSSPISFAGAAVMCAVDGCDHLNCHGGAFRVVYCGLRQHELWLIMYSSQTREWSSMISIDAHGDYFRRLSCSTLVGNALYFGVKLDSSLGMLKYDWGRHELSVISSPDVMDAVATKLDDGGLGFVGVLGNCIYTWSWQADANNNGTGIWAQHMFIEIDTVLPRPSSPHFPCRVIGLVEGTDTIFINTEGLYALDLKSRKAKEMGKRVDGPWIIPYMSFYTPDCGRFPSLVATLADA